MTEEQKREEELREQNTDSAQTPEDEEQSAQAEEKKETGEEEKKAEEKTETAEGKPAEKKEEDEELSVRYMRLMADFQNFRKRTEKEKSDIYAYASEKLVMDLLPVMDNFERALCSKTEGDKFAEGMELIYKQMSDVLTKNNVTEIEAQGKIFDPNLHNAVSKQPADGVESDVITTVLQKGYMLNGKVIRPSMVIVAE